MTVLADVPPAVRNLAERKAMAFVRRYRIPFYEYEDIQSQLLLHFLSRSSRFDSERASILTFASRLMGNELLSILRYRLAGRRGPEENNEPLDQHLGSRWGFLPCNVEQSQFWLDIERTLDPFPKVFLETAQALCSNSPSEASQLLQCSRTTLYKRLHLIREVFVGAGIGPDYFRNWRCTQ